MHAVVCRNIPYIVLVNLMENISAIIKSNSILLITMSNTQGWSWRIRTPFASKLHCVTKSILLFMYIQWMLNPLGFLMCLFLYNLHLFSENPGSSANGTNCPVNSMGLFLLIIFLLIWSWPTECIRQEDNRGEGLNIPQDVDHIVHYSSFGCHLLVLRSKLIGSDCLSLISPEHG